MLEMDIKDVLSKYLIPLDDFHKTQVDNRVKDYGKDYAWERHLEWLDCSRKFPDGSRVLQTNSHVYSSELAQTLYLIDTYFADDKEERYECILKLHDANIQFEVLEPPVLVPKRKQSNPRRKNDTLSSAELKAKAKAMKIGALKFNIKKELKHE